MPPPEAQRFKEQYDGKLQVIWTAYPYGLERGTYSTLEEHKDYPEGVPLHLRLYSVERPFETLKALIVGAEIVDAQTKQSFLSVENAEAVSLLERVDVAAGRF